MAHPEDANMSTCPRCNGTILTSVIIEAKIIDGKPAHRVEGAPPGCWTFADTAIDAMLNRVMLQLNCSRTAIYDATSITGESVSRCRHGTQPLLDRWILNLSDYSGIPVAELRQVACIEPVVYPHPKARRPPCNSST